MFPRARIVHVVRHGADVAISLRKRETTRPEGRLHPHFSELSQSLEGCFSLWKAYVAQGRSYADTVEHVIEVRFEATDGEDGVELMERVEES